MYLSTGLRLHTSQHVWRFSIGSGGIANVRPHPSMANTLLTELSPQSQKLYVFISINNMWMCFPESKSEPSIPGVLDHEKKEKKTALGWHLVHHQSLLGNTQSSWSAILWSCPPAHKIAVFQALSQCRCLKIGRIVENKDFYLLILCYFSWEENKSTRRQYWPYNRD